MLLGKKQSNELMEKLAKKIIPFQVKLEIVFLLMILVGLFFIEKYPEPANILLIIGFLSFVMLYFLLSFKINESKNKINAFLNKLLYWSFCVGLLGSLYALLQWVGASMMIYAALYALAFETIALIILKIRNKEESQKVFDLDVLRALIIAIVVAGFALFGDLEGEHQGQDNPSVHINEEVDNK